LDVLIGWPGGDWQSTARLAATLVGGYLFILWATSVLWVYRDIQQRTRDPVSQLTAVAIALVFPLVSLPIYAALRPTETLQDSYLRLLEREVLLSELGELQSGGEPRRVAGRAKPVATNSAAANVRPQATEAPVVGNGPPARTTTTPEPASRPRATAPEPPAREATAASVATEAKEERAPEPDSEEPLDEAIRRRI